MRVCSKIDSVLIKITFVLYLINILFFPVLSHVEIDLIRKAVNVFQYSFLIFALYYIVSKFLKKEISFDKSIYLLVVYLLLSLISFLILSKKNLETFSILIKIFECSVYFIYSFQIFKSKKNIIVVCFFILGAISTQFIASILYNIKTPKNIIDAFTGGKYRLGNIESQANGYATYCFYACVLIFLFSLAYKKKLINFLILIPAGICLGTQSKKGILLCWIFLIFSMIYVITKLKTRKIRILLLFLLIACIVSSLILITTKTNILIRFFQKTDDSTVTRVMMFKYLFLNFEDSFLLGQGINNFRSYFYLNNGTDLVFHSTIGDCLYSLGVIGFALYIGFLISVFFNGRKSNKDFWNIFILIIFICQLFSDLTAIVWYMPITFIILAIYPRFEELFKYKISKEDNNYLCLNI